jgi:uncharacterized protein YciI/uncharacterized membrane protein
VTAAYGAALFTGLFAGFLLTVLVLEVSLRDTPAPVYTQVRLVELDHLGTLASALLAPAILAAAVLAQGLLRRRDGTRWLAAAAVLLLLAALVISVSINVPINTDQQTWTVAAPPANWAGMRDRWQLAHAARTAVATSAFLLLVAVPLRWSRIPLSAREDMHDSWSSTLGDSHEVLYLVYSQLVGDDPDDIRRALPEHLSFLSELHRQGKLVLGGPLETPNGANSGNGIYVLDAPSLAAAEQITARDPLHQTGIRVPSVHRWCRKKNWSELPDDEALRR